MNFHIENGVIEGLPDYLSTLDRRIAVISDTTVGPLHANSFSELFIFPAGESYKTRETKAALEDQLLEAGYGRDTVIVGIGGGVVTDMAGFIAATYCRGVPLVLVPTSLLAMVDAGIGGKTGVNVGPYKNYIGAIYPAMSTFIDPTVLATQPPASYRDGLVEMIKHGLVWDSTHFSWIERHIQALLAKEPTLLEKAIRDSCAVKREVVQKDSHEKGLRRILNFGHTIGHAVETASNYGVSHGTAVAYGCLVEAKMSGLPKEEIARIEALFRTIGIPLEQAEAYPLDQLWEIMQHDKKAKGGKPRFVTLKTIGQVESHDGEYCVSRG